MLKNKYKSEDIQIYVLPFDEKEKRKTDRITFVFAIAMIAVQILTGMVNQDSSRTFWIVYPYLFIFLPAAYMFIGAVSYAAAGIRIPTPQYDGSIRRMHKSALGTMGMAIISALCDIVYIILYHSSIRMGAEFLYLLGHVVLVALVVAYGRYYDRIFAGIRTEDGR